MNHKELFPYSEKEEKLNVYTHVFGFLLSVVAFVLLVQKAYCLADGLVYFCYLSYAVSLLIQYAASSLYHNEKEFDRRKKLKIFDHSAIYVLIAGSYMPFALLGIGGRCGSIIAITVAAIAIIGVALKFFFTGRYGLLSTLSYVFMGCIVLGAMKPLVKNVNPQTLWCILGGGLFYILGAVFYSIDRMPYNHAIFHVFVLLGSFSHFLGVWLYL